MKKIKHSKNELQPFLVLWSTQSLSRLGSAMTSFALTLWLYEQTGSALQTAFLSICSYTPYVLMSILAGALSDRWNKKRTMLACDTFAAVCSLAVLFLLKTNSLRPFHMYVLNAVTGLMNTVQQPAGEVAMTLITPKEQYQRTSGLRSFSDALVNILHPVLAGSLYAAAGMDGVIGVDLATFAIAFMALAFRVHIPSVDAQRRDGSGETVLASARAGLSYLHHNGLILWLILFLAGVNFVASAFDAALPPYVLSHANGGKAVLGIVMSCAGIATLAGSLAVSVLPAPRNRIRVIFLTMLFSLGTENFMLAFARTPVWWCAAQIIGWSVVPIMSANLDVILRSTIPPEMQGRVYSCRNTMQFFTIPIGTFAGGFLVDKVCEPLMARADPEGLPAVMFGVGKGSGAALVMFLLGILSVAVCLFFGRILRKYEFTEASGKK